MSRQPICECGECKTCQARVRNMRFRERQAMRTHEAALAHPDDIDMGDWLRLAEEDRTAIVGEYLAERVR